jgi:hypothetical protein
MKRPEHQVQPDKVTYGLGEGGREAKGKKRRRRQHTRLACIEPAAAAAFACCADAIAAFASLRAAFAACELAPNSRTAALYYIRGFKRR